MALLTIVQPVQEPVSLAQFKNYARVGVSTDDELITEQLTAARVWCENYCERSFVFQTKRLLLDFFPGYIDFKLAGQKVSSPFVSGSNAVLVGIRYAIVPPCPQVRKIVNFTYQDQNGNPQTMVLGTSFFQDLDGQPARLTPPFGQMWPVAQVIPNAITIDFISGSIGPIAVSLTAGSAVVAGSFNFLARDVGTVLTIPGAGAPVNGTPGALVGVIASVAAGVATLAAPATTTVTNATVWFDGMPQLRLAKNAIKALALDWYENRSEVGDASDGVKNMLRPFRDLRL